MLGRQALQRQHLAEEWRVVVGPVDPGAGHVIGVGVFWKSLSVSMSCALSCSYVLTPWHQAISQDCFLPFQFIVLSVSTSRSSVAFDVFRIS